MKKLWTCLAVLLSCGICFIDKSLGGCNCQTSSASRNSETPNNKTKIVNNNSSRTDQSAKLSKKQLEEMKEEELFKKELQELQEFLEQSKEETENSK